MRVLGILTPDTMIECFPHLGHRVEDAAPSEQASVGNRAGIEHDRHDAASRYARTFADGGDSFRALGCQALTAGPHSADPFESLASITRGSAFLRPPTSTVGMSPLAAAR